MLHRDYLLEVIEQFVNTVAEALRLARQTGDTAAAQEAEQAVGELLDLEADVALRLSGDSLVTMMGLSGVGDALAEYVTYALAQLAETYEAWGDDATAALRRDQARTVARAYGVDEGVVPEGFSQEGEVRA